MKKINDKLMNICWCFRFVKVTHWCLLPASAELLGEAEGHTTITVESWQRNVQFLKVSTLAVIGFQAVGCRVFGQLINSLSNCWVWSLVALLCTVLA